MTIVRDCLPRLRAAGVVKTLGPVDQPYNQREFMIAAPDGDMFVFGQPIPRQSPPERLSHGGAGD